MPAPRSADARLKVTLLSGYLGSGKTTILNALLRHPEMQRTAVVVNEFGEIGIDHLLIAKSSDNLIELSNGCVCCTIQSDLVTTLFGLYADRVNRKIPPFDRVIIETTGLAEPGPILLALFRDPTLAPRFSLGSVLIVVDAVNGAATLESHREAVSQAAAADRLLLTKTDLASAPEIASVKDHLAAINPGCPIVEIRQGAVDLAILSSLRLDEEQDPALAARRWLEMPPGQGGADLHAHGRAPGHEHEHDARGHSAHDLHEHGISSRAVVIERAIEWQSFLAWVEAVRKLLGRKLLRVKGLVMIAGREQEPLVVHAVQSVFHPPTFMAEWPSQDRRSRLVFIVKDLDPALIEDTLILLRAERRG